MASIIGTVALKGKPLGGVYIRLSGPSGEFVSEQYTKDDGAFTFHVAPGAWTLEARAAGTTTETQTIEVSEAAGESSVVAVDLSPA